MRDAMEEVGNCWKVDLFECEIVEIFDPDGLILIDCDLCCVALPLCQWERRVPLIPSDVAKLTKQGVRVLVQPSTMRIFKDSEFKQVRITPLTKHHAKYDVDGILQCTIPRYLICHLLSLSPPLFLFLGWCRID